MAVLIPVLVSLGHAPASASAPIGPRPSAPGIGAAASEVTYPTAIRHVFVVFLENADLSAV
ncbi:MAG TPA: hypothetical protein VGS18_04405, partial [Thermoplasmata archaeon]|nr:hypothetical protein [Thermoplasmata archaeon]